MGGGIARNFFRIIFEFIALMFLFDRTGIILHSFSSISSLFRFTGARISLQSRFAQYSEFLYSIFFSPHAGLHSDTSFSWQLYPAESINYIGIAILALALFSAFINRKSKICRVSFMWVIFSFVILCLIGWGTAENGLILYSLYFSWAFYILIFMLFLKAEEFLKVKFLVPLLVIAALCLFLKVSFPAICELADFGSKYYPYSW